jgi:hypothetical protein
MGRATDAMMQALAMDLMVGAAPRLVIKWMTARDTSAADRPRGATPVPSFERLIRVLDEGPQDLVLFGDRRPDNKASFVATFFDTADCLVVTLEDLATRVTTLATLATLLRLQAGGQVAPFRIFHMAHVRGELHVSRFLGTPFLQYYYVGDYFIVWALRLHVLMLRQCRLHELRDRSMHASIHLATATLCRKLSATRGATGMAGIYATLARGFDHIGRALSEAEANEGFAQLGDMLRDIVHRTRDGLGERIHKTLARGAVL